MNVFLGLCWLSLSSGFVWAVLDDFLVSLVLCRDVYEDKTHQQFELIHFLTFLGQKKVTYVSSHKMCFEKMCLEYSKNRVNVCQKSHCELFLNHVKDFRVADRGLWVTLTLNHDAGNFQWHMDKQSKFSQGCDNSG